MDERAIIRAAALRRARRECPEARARVEAMRDEKRWFFYWKANTYDSTTDRRLAIATATIERGE